MQHELTFQLLSHSAAAGGVVLAGAHLSPDVPPIRAFLDAAVDGSDITPAYIVSLCVCMPQCGAVSLCMCA